MTVDVRPIANFTAAISPPLRPKGRFGARMYVARCRVCVLAGVRQKGHSRADIERHRALDSRFADPVRQPNQFAKGDLVIHSLPRHAATVGIALALSLSSALAAETPAQQQLSPENAFGSYLAARHAGSRARRGRRRHLLSRRAQARSAQHRSSEPRVSLRAYRRRYRRREQARRPVARDRSHRSHFAPRRRHPRTQEETLRRRPARILRSRCAAR